MEQQTQAADPNSLAAHPKCITLSGVMHFLKEWGFSELFLKPLVPRDIATEWLVLEGLVGTQLWAKGE